MSPVPSPLVAMIHANGAAARLAQQAFEEVFPEAGVWHLLDDRLLEDARDGVRGEPQRRMLRLIEHAFTGGADAVLLTCSAYGPVVDVARQLWDRPIDRPDEAVFHDVVRGGFARVAVLASVAPAVDPAMEQMRALVADTGAETEVRTVLCEDAARAGDAPEEAVSVVLPHLENGGFDAVVLAQYSLSPVAGLLSDSLGLPVFSGPRAAALRMRERLTGEPVRDGTP
ncbi:MULTISPECIES: aspartate/glutamate racemase family protein [unclassified Nocardiopsis]|uniref:aspartate/glutamate racemase family protein n=1 Tax=unclassified Nocardiopsis TaxID=2649073 RepID=UPI001915AAA2|nr:MULTISPECIES: aspartate/glutamate racemase family protein [unclassified Nocardiopsis]